MPAAPARQGGIMASGASDSHTWGHILALPQLSRSWVGRLPSSSSRRVLCKIKVVLLTFILM